MDAQKPRIRICHSAQGHGEHTAPSHKKKYVTGHRAKGTTKYPDTKYATQHRATVNTQPLTKNVSHSHKAQEYGQHTSPDTNKAQGTGLQ